MHPTFIRGLRNLVAGAALLMAAPTHAADVCYQGGPLLPNFQLNGNATLDGTALVVTQASSTQNGSISYLPKFSTGGDIHILMKVLITTPAGNQGADGLAFVMHNAPQGVSVTGQSGGGIGYGGISPSIAVEFDTYANANENANHVAITRNGNTDHTAAINAGLPYNADPGVNLKSGTPLFLWMDYLHTGTVLKVYVATTAVKPAVATLSTTAVNLATALGPAFFMTFTASTGGAWSKHEVQELYASDILPDPKQGCCATDAECAGNQVCDPVKHLCGDCTLADNGGCGPVTPACSLASSENSCVSECTGDLGSAGAVPCGAAFPACRGDGQCASCNGDALTAGTIRCPSGAPLCSDSGYCGRCTSSADCTAGTALHAGPFCDPGTGACRTCVADAECGAGAICSAATCITRAANGSPVPGGVCTVATANRCISGVCSPGDNLCGRVISETCFDVDDCRSPGKCLTEGPNAGTCRTCASAADCGGATPICAAANSCVPCNGDNGSGTSAACSTSASATCMADGSCAACTSNAQCTGAGHAGTICNTAVGSCGTACAVDSDCGADWCDNPGGQPGGGTCTGRLSNGQLIPASAPLNGVCTADNGIRVCASRSCNSADNRCGRAIGDACDADDCREGSLCLVEGPNADTCQACASAANCSGTSPACDAANACVACSGDNGSGAPTACPSSNAATCFADGSCAPCTGNEQCAGAGHGGTICNLAVGTCGTACAVDTDCGGGWCDNPTALPGVGTCTPRLDNGAPIPASSPLGGICTEPTAQRVCIARVCDPGDNLCGRPIGGACADGDDCRTGSCITDGPNVGTCRACSASADCTGGTPICDSANVCVTCGGDNGAGTLASCPSSSAATCLESGACAPCSSNAECVGAAHAGPICNRAIGACGTACTLDADCGNGWCNNSTGAAGAGVCAPRISNGEPIPAVAPLGGECTTDNGARVCAARVCDETDDRCGARFGGPCDGEAACRSGHCASGSNTCVECTQNTHCAAGKSCNAQTGTCEASTTPDGGVSSSSSGGSSSSSSSSSSSGTPNSGDTPDDGLGAESLTGGAGCSVVRGGTTSALWLVGLLLLGRRRARHAQP